MDKIAIKKYLKSYRGAMECIEFAENEIARLEGLKAQEQGKTGGIGDGMPRAPGVKDATYAACQRAMDLYDAEISLQKRNVIEAKERIEQINILVGLSGTVKARHILIKHYCEGKSWDSLAEEMHYSSRHLKRIGRRAIDIIEKRCHFYVTFLK